MHIEVETQNVNGQVTALGGAGPFTLVVDRSVEGGGLASTVANCSILRAPDVSQMISSAMRAQLASN
jgi:hypothetical protein